MRSALRVLSALNSLLKVYSEKQRGALTGNNREQIERGGYDIAWDLVASHDILMSKDEKLEVQHSVGPPRSFAHQNI
jgi:hypothetical protein